MDEEEEEEKKNFIPESSSSTSSSCICPPHEFEPSCHQHGDPAIYSNLPHPTSSNPPSSSSSSSTPSSSISTTPNPPLSGLKKKKKKGKKISGKVPSWQLQVPHDEIKLALEKAREDEMKIFYLDPGLTKIAQVMTDCQTFSAWRGGDVLHEQSSTKEFYKRVI